MVVIKVVAMFDDEAALLRAREELLRAGLATPETLTNEPDLLSEEATAPSSPTGWERLTAFFDAETGHDVSAYAEGLRRGSALLVVETPNEQAEKVKDVLRRNGAVDLRRRVHRWITTGWETFDPAAPRYTELEILDERRAVLSEAAIALDAGLEDGPDRSISLFEEKRDLPLGRVTEGELAALQASLQKEGPDDDNYWINSDEIESIAASPGATPHLIAVLRRALGSSPDGVDIRFERARKP
jgi:hypothetical protein